MEIQNILTLMQAFTQHSLTELHVEDGGVKVYLKREMESRPAMPAKMGEACLLLKPEQAATQAQTMPLEPAAGDFAAKLPVTEGAGEIKEAAEIGSDKVVASPLVGIFYSAPSPEAENFVKEGDVVKKGQILGIVEAMKLMNEIESEYDGVVEAVLVKNQEVVEYGQPLFRIR